MMKNTGQKKKYALQYSCNQSAQSKLIPSPFRMGRPLGAAPFFAVGLDGTRRKTPENLQYFFGFLRKYISKI